MFYWHSYYFTITQIKEKKRCVLKTDWCNQSREIDTGSWNSAVENGFQMNNVIFICLSDINAKIATANVLKSMTFKVLMLIMQNSL